MKQKQSHYALDLKVKIGSEEYSLNDLASGQYYHGIYLKSIYKIILSEIKDEVPKLILDFPPEREKQLCSEQGLNAELVRIYQTEKEALKTQTIEEFNRTYRDYKVNAVFSLIQSEIATKHPKLKELNDAHMPKWLKIRPGVKKIFEEVYPNKVLDLEALIEANSNWNFKTKLEIARPTNYSLGDFVELRKEFIGKYYKDPLWREGVEASRKGFVTKHIGNASSMKGSRQIEVYWLVSGKLTSISEKYIKIIPKEETPTGQEPKE